MPNDREPTLTKQTMLVLSILMGSAEPIAGSAIAAESRLASGSLYPILIRLEKAGWIKSEWEDDEERAKPRRRVYFMTPLGVRRSRQEARDWRHLTERFA
jgi:DNA-binding MarR family transcriptional regulator